MVLTKHVILAWFILFLLLIALVIISGTPTCVRRGGKKAENILDWALNGAMDKQEASQLIDFILLEIGMQMVSDVMKMKNVCLEEMMHMTNEQRKQVLFYCLHMAEFCMELCIWAKKIIDKIIEEAFKGKKMERNITSKFFQGFIQAFQKANLTELIRSHHNK